MPWLIAAAGLLLLGLLPIGVRSVYNVHGLSVSLIVGPVTIRIFPTSKASNRQEKQDEKAKTGKKEANKSGGSLSDFKPLVRLVLTMLDEFRRKLRVSCLEFQLVLAGSDPCDVSLQYGRAWAVVGNTLPLLERFLTIGHRQIDVCCDYTTEQSRVYARVYLTISIGRLLHLAARRGFPILKEYQNIMNTRKGGAKL